MAWGPPRRPRLISFALSTPFCLPSSLPVPLEFAFRDGSEEPPPHSLASWNIFCQLIELTRFLAGAAIPLRLSNSGPRRGRPLGLYDTPLIMPTVALHFTAHTWATCPALASSPERWYPWQLIRGGGGRCRRSSSTLEGLPAASPLRSGSRRNNDFLAAETGVTNVESLWSEAGSPSASWQRCCLDDIFLEDERHVGSCAGTGAW